MKDQEYDFFYEDKGDTEYCYPGTNILNDRVSHSRYFSDELTDAQFFC